MLITPETTLVEIAKSDGVKDLPTEQKKLFVQALKKEAQGKHEEAQKLLDTAIEAAA